NIKSVRKDIIVGFQLRKITHQPKTEPGPQAIAINFPGLGIQPTHIGSNFQPDADFAVVFLPNGRQRHQTDQKNYKDLLHGQPDW
ncbi:MAG: hypothetical protein AAGB22_15135, partial [Bacteroidota bacterium]